MACHGPYLPLLVGVSLIGSAGQVHVCGEYSPTCPAIGELDFHGSVTHVHVQSAPSLLILIFYC